MKAPAALLRRIKEEEFEDTLTILKEQKLLKRGRKKGAVSLTKEGYRYLESVFKEKTELFVLFHIYWSIIQENFQTTPLRIIKKKERVYGFDEDDGMIEVHGD